LDEDERRFHTIKEKLQITRLGIPPLEGWCKLDTDGSFGAAGTAALA
jgi:hypothetical protein